MRTDEEHVIWLANKAKKEQEAVERIKQEWPKINYPIEAAKFSPRISAVLQKLPCPQSHKIESSYISGISGSGKTIKAARMILANSYHVAINDGQSSYLFTSVIQILSELRMSYNNRPDYPTEMEIIEKYSKIPILVLDDIGTEKTSDWAYQHLYLILNNRYEAMLVTVFTSNYDLDQLSQILQDNRIPARIQEMCTIIKMKNIDYRNQ
jgi:DNA replication protein DnaC